MADPPQVSNVLEKLKLYEQTSGKEISHVTEELYKKNVELADRNKTLSIIRQIDEVTASSLTDIQQIAQTITKIVVNEVGFKAMFIFLLKKEDGILIPLSVSLAKQALDLDPNLERTIFSLKISLTEKDNILVKSVLENKPQEAEDFYSLFVGHITQEASQTIQKATGIKYFHVHPLAVRGEVIGGMMVSFEELAESVIHFRRDVIERLPSLISIALDNALLYQSIQKANEQLKALDKLKDEFVSLASHELRTPMTAIKSYLWMALNGKGGPLSEKQHFYLDRAYSSTNRLINLVNEMLNVSRIESGRMSIAPAKTDIVKLVEDVIAEVKPRADELKIDIKHETLNMKQEKLPEVLADQDKIKEVLINLIGNSLKFTPEGGMITISFTNETGQSNNNVVTVSVMDTGRGIDPADIDKLFKKFSMLSSSYSSAESVKMGTGLGLYISKSIVELHGGTIGVKSEGTGKGATFSFTLPVYHEGDEKKVEIIHTTV